MDPEKLKQWREDAIESFEQAKEHFVQKCGKETILTVLNEILGPGFPDSPDTLHTLREEDVLKAAFYSHCLGVHRVVDIVINMIRDGVLNPDGDRAQKVAARMESTEEKEETFFFKPGTEDNGDDGDDCGNAANF